MESTNKPCTPAPSRCSGVHVTLRLLLFAASLTAVVLMVTSKQTAPVAVPGLPFTVNIAAKFNHSPAFIYFVVALSVACLYSIITTLASLSALMSKSASSKYLFLFAVWDVLLLGMVASATGAAGGVGYIGLKGNEHVSWNKVCNVYDKFCKHVGSSIAMSLFAAILLVVLSMLSTYSLYKRVHD